jgi:hypothetical protein
MYTCNEMGDKVICNEGKSYLVTVCPLKFRNGHLYSDLEWISVCSSFPDTSIIFQFPVVALVIDS